MNVRSLNRQYQQCVAILYSLFCTNVTSSASTPILFNDDVWESPQPIPGSWHFDGRPLELLRIVPCGQTDESLDSLRTAHVQTARDYDRALTTTDPYRSAPVLRWSEFPTSLMTLRKAKVGSAPSCVCFIRTHILPQRASTRAPITWLVCKWVPKNAIGPPFYPLSNKTIPINFWALAVVAVELWCNEVTIRV